MATNTTTAPITANSPRPVIEAALHAANQAAKVYPPTSPAYDVVHRRINQLLDWLTGR